MSSALYNCRHIIYTNCRRLSMTAFIKNNPRGFTKFKELQSSPILIARTTTIRRCLTTQTNPDSNEKPAYNPLMKYPPVCWPGFFQMIGCWLTFKLALPSLDKDFDLVEFIEGTQQAVCIVSNALSREDYESLDGLVAPEAIEALKTSVSKLSDEQKRQLCLEKKEFFFCFPWQISVRKGTEEYSKIVEVAMVFHFLRNWKDPEAPSKIVTANSGMQRLDIMHGTVSSPEYPSHAIVCNYRFIREFGSSDKSWSINIVNQFKLSDIE